MNLAQLMTTMTSCSREFHRLTINWLEKVFPLIIMNFLMSWNLSLLLSYDRGCSEVLDPPSLLLRDIFQLKLFFSEKWRVDDVETFCESKSPKCFSWKKSHKKPTLEKTWNLLLFWFQTTFPSKISFFKENFHNIYSPQRQTQMFPLIPKWNFFGLFSLLKV